MADDKQPTKKKKKKKTHEVSDEDTIYFRAIEVDNEIAPDKFTVESFTVYCNK